MPDFLATSNQIDEITALHLKSAALMTGGAHHVALPQLTIKGQRGTELNSGGAARIWQGLSVIATMLFRTPFVDLTNSSQKAGMATLIRINANLREF